MASLLFVAFGAVLTVVSVLLSRRQPMWARKRKWWELTHSKDSVKPLRAGFALQELKSGWRPARSLVIVRVRQPGAAPRVWIGTSAENDDVVAHHVAEAAGCVAKRCAPPTGIARASGWRISYVRSNGASGDSKVPRPGNDYLKGLAADLNAHLGDGDAMVLTLIPCRDKARVKARAAIRARSLRNSWADRAKTSRFLPLPSIAGYVLPA